MLTVAPDVTASARGDVNRPPREVVPAPVMAVAVMVMMAMTPAHLDHVGSVLRVDLCRGRGGAKIVGGGRLRHRCGGAEGECGNGGYQYSFEHGSVLLVT